MTAHLARCLPGLLFVVLCFLLPPASALETLHLRNGDRITGEFVTRENGQIVFRAPLLGEFRIPEDQAVVVELPDTPIESLANLPPMEVEPPAAFLSAKHTPASSADQSPDQLSPWKGKVEFGFQQQTGRQQNLNVSLRASADLKRARNSYRTESRILYGEQNENPNLDRSDASFRWRHNISETIFTQTISSYSRDQIKGIKQHWEQNVGAGYRLYEDKRQTLNVGAGLTGQYRDSLTSDPGYYGLLEVFQDYSFKINGRLTLLQNAVAQYSPDGQGSFNLVNNQPVRTASGEANYKLRFNTTLQGKVSEKISLNIRYEYEFDNAVFTTNAEGDQRITSSIGYAF
jgi:putative salt-induced outer membrane protein YdiY